MSEDRVFEPTSVFIAPLGRDGSEPQWRPMGTTDDALVLEPQGWMDDIEPEPWSISREFSVTFTGVRLPEWLLTELGWPWWRRALARLRSLVRRRA